RGVRAWEGAGAGGGSSGRSAAGAGQSGVNYLERGMPYRGAEDPPLVVRDLENPAGPPPRIAADLRVDQIAHDCPRLIARGRPVRQLDALLVGHHALAEAEVEKVMRHDLLPRSTRRWISPKRPHVRTSPRRGRLALRH